MKNKQRLLGIINDQILQKVCRVIAVLALVSLMYGMAEWTKKVEFIFPEISALAMGSWIFSNKEWTKNHFHFWFSPTMASIFGIAIPAIFPSMNLLTVVITVYFLTAGMLFLIDSLVAPSISAAMLPVLLHINSLYYVLSVFIFTSVIVIVKILSDYQKGPLITGFRKLTNDERTNRNKIEEVIHWLFIGIVVYFIALMAIQKGWLFIIAPPLVVTLFEFTKIHSPLKNSPIRLLFLIVTSSLWGTICIKIFYNVLHIPLWLSAAFIVFSIICFFKVFKLSFPPAAAIVFVTIYHPR